MAKMFYSLEEAAAALKMTDDQVKQLATTGKLQQFRDRDRLMFKRDQVDQMARAAGAEDSGSAITLGDSGSGSGISLDTGSGSSLILSDGGSGSGSASASGSGGLSGGRARPKDKGDTDALDLAAETIAQPSKKEDPKQATGVSVFDVNEVDHADPNTQTQVNKSTASDEDLALESVGSGSGLLDLTRESDDTSLGAELLDEIYPATGAESDTKVETVGDSSAALGSGALDAGNTVAAGATIAAGAAAGATLAAAATTEGTESPSSVELGPPPSSDLESGAAITQVQYATGPIEAYDPAGSAMSAGFLFGAMASLIAGMVIAIFAVTGVKSALVTFLAESSNTVMMYGGILLGASIVFGIAGFFVGKATAR